jgi:hypothetical protein
VGKHWGSSAHYFSSVRFVGRPLLNAMGAAVVGPANPNPGLVGGARPLSCSVPRWRRKAGCCQWPRQSTKEFGPARLVQARHVLYFMSGCTAGGAYAPEHCWLLEKRLKVGHRSRPAARPTRYVRAAAEAADLGVHARPQVRSLRCGSGVVRREDIEHLTDTVRGAR